MRKITIFIWFLSIFSVAQEVEKKSLIFKEIGFNSSFLKKQSQNVIYNIKDLRWTNKIDQDNDGYDRSRKLEFNPDVSNGSATIYANIYYKLSSSTRYVFYKKTGNIGISGNTNRYYSVDINSLNRGIYDFRIDLVDANTKVVKDFENANSKAILNDERFEKTSEDPTQQTFNITSASWTNIVDNDKDGYRSSGRLVFRPSVSSGTATVYARIYRKLYNSNNYSLYKTTNNFSISSVASNSYNIDIGGANGELARGIYDFRIDLFKSGSTSIKATRGPSNDPDLNDERFEKTSEDPTQQTFNITSASWTNIVDNDKDGYRSSGRLVFRPSVSSGTATVYARIYRKLYNSNNYSLYKTTNNFSISSVASNSYNIDIGGANGELARGIYDFRIDLFKSGSTSIKATRGPSNDPDLNDERFEKTSEDNSNNTNCIFVKDTDAFKATKNNIEIVLENSKTLKGFQFDVEIPIGFTFQIPDLKKSPLLDNFQVSGSYINSNTIRIIAFSLNNAVISTNKQSLLTLPIYIDKSVTEGKYQIPITNKIISDVNNDNIASNCTADGTVTVKSGIQGDVNSDLVVNILDILGVVDHIFGNTPSNFNSALADLNTDNTINVLDILEIQDIILGSNTSSKSTINHSKTDLNYLFIKDLTVSPDSNNKLEIKLKNNNIIKGMQFDVELPSGVTFNPSDIESTTRLDGFNVSSNKLSGNTYRVLIFSLTSKTLPVGDGTILKLPISISSDISLDTYPITFTKVTLSNTNNVNVASTPETIGNIIINTLSNYELEKNFSFLVFPNPAKDNITITSSFEINKVEVYSLLGKRVIESTTTKSINIKKLSNAIYFVKVITKRGSAIKRFVKQ
ncbi:choice-of-anchor H family protein [Polaribacter aquimarinus]|uniref:Dockerin domain-containing protein n=3 Tax=Polaribacter TaxID=52959 RepID=A0A2U2JCC3_9FLAO|nr:choice-of-anchor H family protein [Polaribacter aquimarinus]PWG05974.1 hypothetical protein DIS07_05925 [Polaribacter aquimarinus]